jgi:acyl-CoA thioesterase FadM
MTILKLHSEALDPNWLDAYGHLNEAYYLVPFTNATWKLQDHFGIGVDYFGRTGCALYTVETHVRYLDEVRAPATLEVETLIIEAHEKKLWFAHQMVVDGSLRCSAEFLVLHYATREGKTIPMPAEVVERLRDAAVETIPEWCGRRIKP